MIHKIQQSPISVNLTQIFSELTNDIVCRVALGRKYGVGEDGKKFRSLLLEFGELLGSFSVRDFIPWLGWIDGISGLDAKAERVANEIDAFLNRVIEDHVETGEISVDKHKDLVDILLSIQKQDSIGFPLEMDSIKALILVKQPRPSLSLSTVHNKVFNFTRILGHRTCLQQVQTRRIQCWSGQCRNF